MQRLVSGVPPADAKAREHGFVLDYAFLVAVQEGIKQRFDPKAKHKQHLPYVPYVQQIEAVVTEMIALGYSHIDR